LWQVKPAEKQAQTKRLSVGQEAQAKKIAQSLRARRLLERK